MRNGPNDIESMFGGDASVVSDARGVMLTHEAYARLVEQVTEANDRAGERFRVTLVLLILGALSGSAFGAGAMRIFGCH